MASGSATKPVGTSPDGLLKCPLLHGGLQVVSYVSQLFQDELPNQEPPFALLSPLGHLDLKVSGHSTMLSLIAHVLGKGLEGKEGKRRKGKTLCLKNNSGLVSLSRILSTH